MNLSFESLFFELTGFPPFCWQKRLFRDFEKGSLPEAIDLPTGLGKTSIMPIWLIARALGVDLPRRLIYVVDRRAVVDQATAEAEKLRAVVDCNPQLKESLGLLGASLPISTLRGRFVDNRDWLADPGRTAIVVGTVDMVGSRLLFRGYGVSRVMRPYQAALLGVDSLFVLDEAHLVPPFERLLDAIRRDRETFGPRKEADRWIVPGFKCLPLSATGRQSAASSVFRLINEDWQDQEVATRLAAPKKLRLHDVADGKLPDLLAAEAWRLMRRGPGPIRCILFCNRREDAEAAKHWLDERIAAERKDAAFDAVTELFVGARRVKEREDASAWLRSHGFIASEEPVGKSALLVATSAGEVGVDLDADHLVCDLVAWERMVQRLGRVNRRGKRSDTEVHVFCSAHVKDEKNAERLTATAALLSRLPRLDDGLDASPGALDKLRTEVGSEEVASASTPEPLRPALTRALVDAWSMTWLVKHTGRPEIGPWLRGWIENDEPQTSILWRTYLPVRKNGGVASPAEIAEFFDAAAPHVSEKLEAETWRVVEWLLARVDCAPHVDGKKESNGADVEGAGALREAQLEGENRVASEPLRSEDAVVFVLDSAGDYVRPPERGNYTLDDLRIVKSAKNAKIFVERLKRDLAGTTLVVDARLGGLHDGLLNADWALKPSTADGGLWLSTIDERPVVGFRVHPPAANDAAIAQELLAAGHEVFEFVTKRSDEGDDLEALLIETWITEESRATSLNPQLLTEHHAWTRQRAVAIAEAAGLPSDYVMALALAASLHDEGKRSARWQRAFNVPPGRVLAKSRGPLNLKRLGGYRHEFGSLPYAEADEEFRGLPAHLQDIVLHVIAAHHGRARPFIDTSSCDDAPPTVLESRAREVALRFARLQARWGPWGLAWWEALMRAADQQASRENDALANVATQKSTKSEPT